MLSLSPHCSNLGPLQGPQASIVSDAHQLKIRFQYDGAKEVFVSDKFSEEFQNWGLWEYDVFEVFLSRSADGLPYLEAQVSPLDQKFALLVEKPRQKSGYPSRLPFQTFTTVKDGVWTSEFVFQLEDIPGDPALPARGNLHAILGKNRSHFSLVPNEEERPDFHRPDLFIEFGQAAKGAL